MNLSKQKKQIILLYCSTCLGVLMGVISSVINTRALTPEKYGDVRYIQNFISFVSSLLLFGYFTSGSRLLAISKDESQSRRIRGIMSVILGLAIAIVMVVMLVCSFFNQHSNQTMSNLFLISVPLCGSALMLSYINTTAQGDNHIIRIAIARFLPTLLYCIVAFFCYKIVEPSSWLMLLLYNGIATVVLVTIILSTKPDFSNLRESFALLRKENKSYGLNVYVGSLFGVSTSYIAGITLGHFCDNNANVGFYTLALTIATPLATLPAIIGTSYFKRFAFENRITRKVMMGSFGLTFASLLIFVAFIKYVVLFLYDDSYSCVSEYASYLAVGMCFHGLGDMINRFLGSHGQGKQLRNAAFVCGIIVILGSTLFVYLWGIDGAVITKICSSFAYFVTLMLYYYRYIHSKKESV